MKCKEVMQFAQKDRANSGRGWGLEHSSDAEATTTPSLLPLRNKEHHTEHDLAFVETVRGVPAWKRPEGMFIKLPTPFWGSSPITFCFKNFKYFCCSDFSQWTWVVFVIYNLQMPILRNNHQVGQCQGDRVPTFCLISLPQPFIPSSVNQGW